MNKLPLSDHHKLLVFNLSGVLLYRSRSLEGMRHSDFKINNGVHIWKRPHLAPFLNFCFENFDVAVWSSAKMENVQSAVDCVFGNSKKNLKFVWGQERCTKTGNYHPDNKYKPLFYKDLRKLWRNSEYRGIYDKTNTLLIDDDRYKAELTPNNAIHPEEWNPNKEDDNDLDVNGKLRKLLTELLNENDVQTFVLESGMKGLDIGSFNFRSGGHPIMYSNASTTKTDNHDRTVVSNMPWVNPNQFRLHPDLHKNEIKPNTPNPTPEQKKEDKPIKKAEKTPMSSSETALFMSNLPYYYNDKNLSDLLEGLDVSSVRVFKKATDQNQCFGLVEMKDHASQENALKAMKNKVVNGKKINVRAVIGITGSHA